MGCVTREVVQSTKCICTGYAYNNIYLLAAGVCINLRLVLYRAMSKLRLHFSFQVLSIWVAAVCKSQSINSNITIFRFLFSKLFIFFLPLLCAWTFHVMLSATRALQRQRAHTVAELHAIRYRTQPSVANSTASSGECVWTSSSLPFPSVPQFREYDCFIDRIP